MSDETKFGENGLKLIGGVATIAATLPEGPEIAAIIAGAEFIAEIVDWMTPDNTALALTNLQTQIDRLTSLINQLDGRLNDLVVEVAQTDNRTTLRSLNDYLDDIRIQNIALLDRPLDVDNAVSVANACGVIIDKFLRPGIDFDFDIWRWTDVVEGAAGPEAAQGRFKNLPTLPAYLTGVLVWLAAREPVVQANARARLADDAERIGKHLNAVSVRDTFDKYRDGDRGNPLTVAENIKSRIRAFVITSTINPENGVCKFSFDVRNWMNGEGKTGDFFELLSDDPNALCTVDPFSLGAPSLELDMEAEAGLEATRQLAEVLQRVAATGTVREQFIGTFPTTEVFPPAILYVITQNGDLNWYRNEMSSQRQGSTAWRGPIKVGNGWGALKTVFNGGGAAVYAVQPDGVLLWYGHDGFFDGTSTWRGPKQVGRDWQGFQSIFSGGEYIIYGIQQDGTLLWYRHDGAPSGDETAWAAPHPVGSGWQSLAKVFSGGKGIIYAIRPDGVLLRYLHKGYLTGSLDWEGPEQIGTGWEGFQEITATGDGVIYTFTRDGRVLWYRYGLLSWSSHPFRETWAGPVEIKHGLPGFRSIFPLMDAPFRGPS